ncbi:hypothetical protein PsorP6_013981 [Peronosclerospora sorghi]|uniref:Uncharacterized protein n=1 Tax=Peronosclerospora sorghi TaxID=230839 RepID=A0ACC0VGW5_9STRA|nr:hypothetical protein PsorP6_013981 [Peronosclerospora sorghi]
MKERMKYWCDLLQLLGSARLIQSIDSSTRRSSERTTFTIDMWILNDTKIDGQFDVFSPKKAHEVFPNAKPIFDILPRIWTESI